MTIVLLASVALFALVATSRPILPDSDLAPTPSTLQSTLQAAFQILPGKDDLKFEAARFQFQRPKHQIEDLSTLNTGNVAAITSIESSPGVTSALEAPVDDPVDTTHASDSNGGPRNTPSVVDEQLATAPPAVLAFSCVAALLCLTCVVLMLYIVKSLRSGVLASKTAWKLLPHFWRRSSSGTGTAAKGRLVCAAPPLPQSDMLLSVEEGFAGRHSVHMQGKLLNFDAVSDAESESDDVDEKYQDALDTTPLPRTHDLPLEENVSDSSHVDDPLLPPAGFDLQSCDRSTSLMRELCSSLVSRPAWSVRAIDAPALGLSTRDGDGVTPMHQPLLHPRRRAYRSVVPELDIALAMQLRPGLGIGADSAWMVRFLMTIFGWFAVVLTGRSQ